MGIHLPEVIKASISSEITKVLNSGNLAEGHFNSSAAIQDSFANSSLYDEVSLEYYNYVYTASCGAGLGALLRIIRPPVVVVQSNTMYCLRTIVEHCGAEIVYVDSDPATMVMSEVDLEGTLHELEGTEGVVVLPSHIGGEDQSSIMTNLRDITYGASDSYYFIEDMAHALGNGSLPVGTAGVYSMYATKAIPAGEGGIVVTKSQELESKLRDYLVYDRHNMTSPIGMNTRVSEIQAATMHCALAGADHILNDRGDIWTSYAKACDKHGIEYLNKADTDHNWYKFIITDERVLKIERKSSLLAGNRCLSGTVFGYDITSEVPTEGYPVIPHICLNTNSDHKSENSVDRELISRTLSTLKVIAGKL